MACGGAALIGCSILATPRAASAATAPPVFTPIVAGPPPFGSVSEFLSVNESGRVVGNAVDRTTSRTRPVGWDPSGQRFTDLGLPAGTSNASASSVNSRGDTVAGYLTGSDPTPAWFDASTSTWAHVDTPPAPSSLSALNSHRTGVGVAVTGGPQTPVVWDLDAGTFSTPTALASSGGSFTDINDGGQMSGTTFPAGSGGQPRAMRFDLTTGALVISGILGGPLTEGLAISSTGLVAGRSVLANGDEHPVLWDPSSGTLTDLGLPSGYVGGIARGVNRHRQVVGFLQVAGPAGGSQAFIWDPEHGMQVLPDPPNAVPGSSDGHDINDRGVVVGSAGFGPPNDFGNSGVMWLPPPRPQVSPSSTEAASPTAATRPRAVVRTVVAAPRFAG